MSSIVCNAGPLIALAGIGKVEILRHLFGEVLVAREVRSEIEAGGPHSHGGDIFPTAAWLRVAGLSLPPDPLLTSSLDTGEAATIALARQESAALVLLDEVKARHVARHVYGLHVVGTARLLVEAKRASLIPAVHPLLLRMRDNGYWISDRIIAEIRRQAGE